MPTARSSQISEKRAREIVSLVEDALIEGFVPPGMSGQGQSAIHRAMKVAMASGVVASEQAFRDRLARARKSGFEPDWTRYRQSHEVTGKIGLSVISHQYSTPESREPSGEATRVLVIGDTHCCPKLSNERFTWIGRLIADRRPPHIVQIGDFSSWDSVSSHEAKGSQKAMARPNVDQDFDATRDALSRMQRENPEGYLPIKDELLGNHEYRLNRFEDLTSELGQTLSMRRDEMFARFGWRTREFGAYRFIAGVGFTHAPFSAMGKPFGGVTGAQRAGATSLISIVSGHTHKRDVVTVPKIGGVGKVEMVSVGCALPEGHVENYARHNPTGWWYGVCEMICQDGLIRDMDWITMSTLRARYSNDGGDIRS